MSQGPELPPTPRNNRNNPERRRIPDSEQQEQIVWEESSKIVWEESEDVYKPIPKYFSEINNQFIQFISNIRSKIVMSREPELPPTPRNNPRRIPDSEQQAQIVWKDSDQIVWEESEDVYKPIPKRHSDFQAERGIQKKVIAPRVYIKADALDELKDHLASNTRVEQGGILFGNAYQDQQYGVYVEITAAVAAPATIGTSAHLDFTPDSWQGIMDYAKSKHSGENIVGWYHSHPNIGVFMSGTDMRTQRAFFYHPWCLSIVHDPVSRDIGYFLGEKAEPVQPVIFGRVQYYRHEENKVLEEPSLAPENSQQDLIVRPGDNNTSPESATSPESTSKIKLIILLSGVLLALLVAGLMIWSIRPLPTDISELNPGKRDTGLSKDATSPPFTAYITSMPAETFGYHQHNEDNLLRYPIVKAGSRIGSGKEVTLLVILRESTEMIENVHLYFQEITPSQNVNVDDVMNSLSLERQSYGYSNDIPKDIGYQLKPGQPTAQGFRSTAVDAARGGEFVPRYVGSRKYLHHLNRRSGVMIPLFSSHKDNENIMSVDVLRSQTEDKRVVLKDEVIYIPRQITYIDSSKNPITVHINQILKNGSESR